MIHQGESPQSNEFEQYNTILQEDTHDEKSFDKSSEKTTHSNHHTPHSLFSEWKIIFIIK